MATQIKIKRGLKSQLPRLPIGEMGYCTDTKEMYIGHSEGNLPINNFTATHSKAGTVHTLTGLPTVAGIYTVQFKATADFAEGNTFAGGYTAKPNGEETALPDKAFVVGDIVSVTVDVGGKKLGFKLGGKGFPDGWNQIITAKTGENIQKFSPVVMVKGVDGSIETKTKILNNPDIPIEGNKINDAKFSADGNYVAFVGDTTPSLNIYNQYKSTFTKNTNIDVLPAGIAYSVDFDPTGQYLAVGHSSFPYATIYDIPRDKFIKIPNLESLPTGACKKVSFNSTGEYLLVIYDTAPYFSIYRVTNGAFLNLVKPSSITKTNIKDISFSANGSYFSIFDYNNMISIYKLNANTISLIHEVDTGRTPAEELVWGNKENIFVVRNRPIESSPLALYRVDGDTVTKVSTTTVLWSEVDSLTFDSTDTYLIMIRRDFDGVIVSDFNTRSETSNIMLYKIEGGTFIELTDPIPMINGELNSFAFDSTSNYLAIGSYASPYIGFYKRNGDKFKKMGDYYYTSPPNTIKKILFSPVGFCSITIPSSSTKFSVYKLNEIDGYINSISNPTIKLQRDNNGLSVAFDPLGEYFAFGGIGSDDSVGAPYPSHFVCRQKGGMFIYEHE